MPVAVYVSDGQKVTVNDEIQPPKSDIRNNNQSEIHMTSTRILYLGILLVSVFAALAVAQDKATEGTDPPPAATEGASTNSDSASAESKRWTFELAPYLWVSGVKRETR